MRGVDMPLIEGEVLSCNEGSKGGEDDGGFCVKNEDDEELGEDGREMEEREGGRDAASEIIVS